MRWRRDQHAAMTEDPTILGTETTICSATPFYHLTCESRFFCTRTSSACTAEMPPSRSRTATGACLWSFPRITSSLCVGRIEMCSWLNLASIAKSYLCVPRRSVKKYVGWDPKIAIRRHGEIISSSGPYLRALLLQQRCSRSCRICERWCAGVQGAGRSHSYQR